MPVIKVHSCGTDDGQTQVNLSGATLGLPQGSPRPWQPGVSTCALIGCGSVKPATIV